MAAVAKVDWGCDVDDDDRLKVDRPLDDCLAVEDFEDLLVSM